MEKIDSAQKALLDSNGNPITVGTYFYNKIFLNKFTNTKNRLDQDENIFLRKSYEYEFKQIWDCQAKYYPNIFTEERYIKTATKNIFYQRPLKSQKHLLSVCEFEYRHANIKGVVKEIGIKVAPKSSPTFQLFRILQEVNNLEIKDYKSKVQDLKVSNRNSLVAALMAGNDFTANQIIEHFGYEKSDGFAVNYKQLKGNITVKEIKSNFQKLNISDYENSIRFEYIKENVFNLNLEEEPLHLLWNLFYSVNKEDDIVKKLSETKFIYRKKEAIQVSPLNKDLKNNRIEPKKDGDILFDLVEITKEQAVFLSRNVSFSKTYGNLSTKAMKRLIPFLLKGLHFDKACEAVAANNETLVQYILHKETKKEKMANKVLLDTLMPIKTNSLRNPVVERIINQAINIVNEILKDPNLVSKQEREEGKFEIRIELARELKNSAEKRAKIAKENGTRQTANEQAVLIIKENGVKNPSIGDIEKYKLWQECNLCPYTGEIISLEDLFKSGKIEVEHIFPKSRILDDSFLNKTLAPKTINGEKNQMTAYEYMNSGLARISFEEYVNIVNKNYTGPKQKRLLADSIPDGFLQRQLKETQYINLKLVEHLQLICHHVYTTTGQITDLLKHQWGLNEILMDLNIEKYRKIDSSKIKTKVILNKHTGEVINEAKEYIESYREIKPKKEKPKTAENEVENEVENEAIVDSDIEIVDSSGADSENTPDVDKPKVFQLFGKRDDHRHHALDALVIAFTNQSHIKQLNDLNKNYASYQEAKVNARLFPVPITIPFEVKTEKELRSKQVNYFNNLVKKEIDSLLVTFKQDNKIVSTRKNKLIKGKKIQFIQTENVTIPRGLLHKDSVYSKIDVITKFALHKDFMITKNIDVIRKGVKKVKVKILTNVLSAEHIPFITDANVRTQIENRLIDFGLNMPKVLNSLKQNPIVQSDGSNLQYVNILKKEFVLRYSLNKDFKVADAEFIVDPKVKSIVMERLEDKRIPQIDKFNFYKHPLYFDEANKIPLRKVTLLTNSSDDALRALRINENGKPIDYVALQNNAVNCIYKSTINNKTVYDEIIIPFYDAVSWKISPLAIFDFAIKDPQAVWDFVAEYNLATKYEVLLQYIPKPNYTFVTSLQTNDMFVFGMTLDEINEAVVSNNYKIINKNLYRVQSIAKGQNHFRFHTETMSERINPFRIQCSGSTLKAIKVRLNKLGKIVKVGE